MVFYEAPHKLCATLSDMLEVLGERKIALCRELTKVHEEIIRTTFDDAIAMYEENPPRGEFVVVIDGKSADEIEKEAREGWENMSVSDHVEMYIRQGVDEKEAMKKAAKDRGVSKRDIYNEYKK